MKAIDAEYYGYRDEDDGVLEPLEQEHERKGTIYLLTYFCFYPALPVSSLRVGRNNKIKNNKITHCGLKNIKTIHKLIPIAK